MSIHDVTGFLSYKRSESKSKPLAVSLMRPLYMHGRKIDPNPGGTREGLRRGRLHDGQQCLVATKRVKMDSAIAKCGRLTRKEGVLCRDVSRWYVLTNQGGFFQARPSALMFDKNKPFLFLHGDSKVTMEKSVSASPGGPSCVMKIDTRGRNGPPVKLRAASDSETISWCKATQDVIGLVRAINGDETHAPARLTSGGKLGDERFYTAASGRVALYTRLYELQTMKKRENASSSLTPAKEKEEINRSSSSAERSANLTTELERRDKERHEAIRTMRRVNTSLSAAMKEQEETNTSLEQRNATLATELENRNKERDEELQERLGRIDQLETENAELEAKIQRHDDIVWNLRQGYEHGIHSLRDAKTRLEHERRCLETAQRDFEGERIKLRGAKTHLEDETKSLEIAKSDFEREMEQHALRISRLEADINDSWSSLGALVSLPERSREALGSIAGTLEGVLEECVICCEQLLSGVGTPSFGVTSYACGCSRGGHVRALHVNCIVSMRNLKCPMCSEEIILIAPSLMTPTAVRSFTVRKTRGPAGHGLV